MRVAERRAEQREALILAAERRIAEGAVSSLRARDLAQDIGVALGAIYNLVADLDELILLVTGRTMNRLDEALEAAGRAVATEKPQTQLEALAIRYFQFARDNPLLWRNIFDHRLPKDKELPEEIRIQQARMFRHILEPLDILLPTLSILERQLFAHTLFTATHGVVQLSLEKRLFAVPEQEIEGQLRRLVAAICRGL